MVKLRLARHGRRHRPVYYLVAADARAPRDGRFIEKLGTYTPYIAPAQLQLAIPRALHWLAQGAQPTGRVRDLFRSQGVMLQHHLQVGVRKGKVTNEEASKRLKEWQKTHGAKHQQKVRFIDPKVVPPAKESPAPSKQKASQPIAISDKQAVAPKKTPSQGSSATKAKKTSTKKDKKK